MVMFDRTTFVRSTAHRGLHDARRGIIENTWPAMEAAIANGYAIECDLQRTKDDVPIVFHDFTLDRLMNCTGALLNHAYSDIQACTYKGQTEKLLTLQDLLRRVRGQVPLLIEVKSDWQPPPERWMTEVCRLASAYDGPLALMSFDPAVLEFAKKAEPTIARGLVSGNYRHPDRDPWWPDALSAARAQTLTDLNPIDIVAPDFIAYHVKDLDRAPVRHAREQLGLPVLAWTVRSQIDWQLCTTFADAAIFEGTHPDRD